MGTSLRYRRMIKIGALISTAGVIMLILFGLILLLFPVTKICEENCNYLSSAPEYLRQLINPLFLFISLILISSGVFFIRIGNRQLYRSL
ncbi:hypothetical protein NMY3_00467 [Candidatus Nitrosocosmicus oleophilus]|jgi:uncharacterized membrane protein|uniref:Uncharacterized protein n=1 Tax=Candidatus Nitrosocosmicus oleophilus TaxID=1353260 RepID=A0A654LV49_9ARCH|nr:hypothetical protein NMY3_00467 [Candidatus Nitrosocosmicus oleophilus]